MGAEEQPKNEESSLPPSGNTIKKVLSLTSLQNKDVVQYGTLQQGGENPDQYESLENGPGDERTRRDTVGTDDSEVSVSGLLTSGHNWWDKGKTSVYQLRNVKDTPPMLRYPYIYEGYRVNFTFSLTIKSLFRLHNETWNIWTHLVAAVLYVGLGLYTIAFLESYTDKTGLSKDFDPLWLHMLMFMIYFVCVTLSWSCSALFHTCCCMSKAVMYTVGSFDFIGIFTNIAGCAVPAIFYGFDCYRPFQLAYMIGVASVSMGCCVFVASPKWHIAEGPWARFRQCTYMILVLSCFIPAIHYCAMIESWHPHLTDLFIRIGGLLVLEIIAFSVYVAHIPERWFPGRMAVWGTSHQIFHVVLVIASLEHYWTLREMFAFHASTPCSARTWFR